MEPEDLFGDHPVALAVYETVRSRLEGSGVEPLEVRTSKSRVAFRRQRGSPTCGCPGST